MSQNIYKRIKKAAVKNGLDITGGKIRRTSSRFCFGVEHGDYNGTDLFGVGTDRFIWFGYKPNSKRQVRLYSENFPNDGLSEFELGKVPPLKSQQIADTWARFPYGVNYILQKEGYNLTQGIDGVIYGNIPGGGMSRSASLTINLILSILDANKISEDDKFKIVDMAQAVENEYIGSPCGQLDQIMILFAKKGKGTYCNPNKRTIDYIPLGSGGEDMRIVVMDTGTDRPGLDKSTYKIRRSQCEELVQLARKSGIDISCLADVKDKQLYDKIYSKFQAARPELCKRLKYIYDAQNRFSQIVDAWRAGDINTIGKIFRKDGIGLKDDYVISGPELEAMCDIARTVPGVLGERMLGGGDKGASGALVESASVDNLKKVISEQYPVLVPDYADKYAIHVCKIVDGVQVINGQI